MPRYFTLEEANAALEVIRPWMDEIQSIRETLIRRGPEIWPVVAQAAGNGGSRTASQVALEFERLDALVHLIQETGAHLKDLNLGLLDFPAWRGGREVYLCWQHGEGEIAFWHEIEAGYAGRQPIETF